MYKEDGSFATHTVKVLRGTDVAVGVEVGTSVCVAEFPHAERIILSMRTKENPIPHL
jgi:hypothetical protein